MKLFLIALLSLFVSCSHYRTAIPKGFAQIDEAHWTKAVHPSGIVYRVQKVEFEEKGDLPFWTNAVKTRMQKSGYKLIEEKPLQMQKDPGSLFIYTSPFGNQDFQFWIAFKTTQEGILLAETAGPAQSMLEHEKNILLALSQISENSSEE